MKNKPQIKELEQQVKNIPTSIFKNQEEADKLFTKCQERMQGKCDQSEVTDSPNNETESNKKFVLTSAFANKEAADQLTNEVIKRRQLKDIKPITYEHQENDSEYTYNVTYNKEKLKEILEKLKEYNYITVGKVKSAGNVTKWPATKKNIQKRIAYLFSLSHSSKISNHKLHPETIIHHKENGSDFVTYEYSYERLPDLYFYIDIIINDERVTYYYDLFGYIPKGIPEFISCETQRRLAVQEILNYIDSPELVNHDTDTTIKVSNPDYDYKGLNELYKETLQCLNFKLITVKKKIDNQEAVSGLTLQRKRK